jgi:hypothetical protein
MTRQFINCNPNPLPRECCCRLPFLCRLIMANCAISESISMETTQQFYYPSSDDCFFPLFRQSKTQKRAPSSFRATQCVSHIATVIHHAGPFAKSFELPPSWEITARAGVRGLCAFCFWQTQVFCFFLWFASYHWGSTRLCGVGQTLPSPISNQKAPHTFCANVNGRQTIDVIDRERRERPIIWPFYSFCVSVYLCLLHNARWSCSFFVVFSLSQRSERRRQV